VLLTLHARAKINLYLHVVGKRADGYHLLDSLVVFADLGDALRIAPSRTLTLSIDGPFGAGLPASDDNLVLRAARALAAALAAKNLRAEGAALRLTKRLPVASGIGGGSADAAAALRLLCARDGIDPNETRIRALAADLGADVPACLVSRPVRGEKRGDSLIPLEGVPSGMALLLVNPMRPLATGAVFAHWDGVDRGPLDQGDPLEAARKGRNDLEPPAIEIMPVIGEILTLLAGQDGVLLARMSGSGATCFALFDHEAARDATADMVAAAHPDWWLMRAKLR
jgi:4-diphosphocytidyl-2-C-methyl-D-erythritol kinase